MFECMYWLDAAKAVCQVRVPSFEVGYFLRGYGYRLEGVAGIEDTVRYGHQGGGQDYTGQLRVPYNNNNNNNNNDNTMKGDEMRLRSTTLSYALT